MKRFLERSVGQPLRAGIGALRKDAPARNAAMDWSYERLADQILREERSLDLATLIDRVAEEAMYAAQVSGGAALDIAVWGPSVFHFEAEAAVRRMIGHTFALAADGPAILVMPMTASPFSPARSRRALGYS